MDSQKLIEVLKKISAEIQEQKEFLTELDNVIGDGDHGINLARGFSEIEKKLDSMQTKTPGEILKSAGMTLVSTVGGASGPLYGTGFMKMGAALAGKENVTIDDFIDALDKAIEGIKARGKATQGEKTMLDAMIPALDAMKNSQQTASKEILSEGLQAAKKGVEYTKTIIATKGRASYLGERSIGHQDPGATSFTVMMDILAKEV